MRRSGSAMRVRGRAEPAKGVQPGKGRRVLLLLLLLVMLLLLSLQLDRVRSSHEPPNLGDELVPDRHEVLDERTARRAAAEPRPRARGGLVKHAEPPLDDTRAKHAALGVDGGAHLALPQAPGGQEGREKRGESRWCGDWWSRRRWAGGSGRTKVAIRAGGQARQDGTNKQRGEVREECGGRRGMRRGCVRIAVRFRSVAAEAGEIGRGLTSKRGEASAGSDQRRDEPSDSRSNRTQRAAPGSDSPRTPTTSALSIPDRTPPFPASSRQTAPLRPCPRSTSLHLRPPALGRHPAVQPA